MILEEKELEAKETKEEENPTINSKDQEQKKESVSKVIESDKQELESKTTKEIKPDQIKKQEISNQKPQSNQGSYNNRQGQRNRPPRRNNKRFQRDQEFEERVVNIARVTNVVKGGKRFSFSVLVVIGDKKGRVAQGHGKAREVPEAIKKAIKDAKRSLIRVPIIEGRTIPHIAQEKFVSSEVLLKPATKGRGIIASGAVRSVVELAGYQDIVTKSLGSSNKTNVVKATLKALKTLKTAKEIQDLRNKSRR